MAESIIAKIGLDDSRFHAGLTRVQRATLNANRALGLIGAGVTIGGVVGLSRSVLQLADDVSTAAGTIGVKTDFLQEFQFAAEQMGIGTDKATMGLQRFARRLAQAQQGAGELAPTLAQMGIAVSNADGSFRSTEEVLADFANGIAAIEDPQQRLLAGFKAFDSEGAALVNVLKDGSNGLAELRQQAHDAGAVLESDLIKELDASDKLLKRVFRRGQIEVAKFIGASIRSFKVWGRFFEEFFGEAYNGFKDLLEIGKKLLALDFDGAADLFKKSMRETRSLKEIMLEVTDEVDLQIDKQKELIDLEGRRVAAIQGQTKALEQQRATQAKIQDAAARMAEAKRDRSLLTKEQLGKLPSAAAESDPLIAAINRRVGNLNAGLTPQGDRRLEVRAFENAKLAERQAQAFEALAKALTERGLVGQAQTAQNRADFLRRANPFLQAGERDPYRVQTDQLRTMQEQLAQQKALTEAAGPQGRGLKVVPVMPNT